MRLPLIAIAFLLLAAPPGWADSVTLDNGNMLTGEIVERSDDGAIVLQHPQLGRLRIAGDQYREVNVGDKPRLGVTFRK